MHPWIRLRQPQAFICSYSSRAVNPVPEPVKDVLGQGEVAESGAVDLLGDPARQREAVPVACNGPCLWPRVDAEVS